MPRFDAYVSRQPRFLKLHQAHDWQLKVYGLAASQAASFDAITAAVCQLLPPHLPQPACNDHRYGMGFMVIHQGTMANWLLLNWWEHQDILHNMVFASPLDQPEQITTVADPTIMACAYELEVHIFERQAWIDTVLNAGDNPDFDRYLATTLPGGGHSA